ncbi:MAG: hypothetical protein ACLFNI_11555, partial [Natronomonas sp.]
MNARRAAVLVLVMAALVGGVAAVEWLSTPTYMDGTVPIHADAGPNITVETSEQVEANLNDAFNESADIYLQTKDGEIAIDGDNGVEATIHIQDIEGEWTSVTGLSGGGDWLYLDPGDKQRVGVRGDVDGLQFRNVTLDDGSADLEFVGTEGGTAEFVVEDLPADTEIVLYDPATDTVQSTATTDGDGTLQTTADLDNSTQELELRTTDDFDAPELSDPEPNGQITERPDNLSVSLSSAEAYPVEVEFELDGETVDTVTVNETGEVSVPVEVELGQYNWSATATDATDQTDTIEASFETPDEIKLLEEHDPQEHVNESTLRLRFYTVDGEVAIERTAENGTVDMEGLPPSEFVVFAESDDYYDRTIYIESIFEQEELFLLNSTEFTREDEEAVRSTFVYEDLTGEYPRSVTTLEIERAIDLNDDNESEFMTVAGDYWGASNEFEAVLERGERYRLVIVNQETGDRKVLGTHIPLEDRQQTLRVTGLVEDAKNRSGVTGLAEFSESGEEIDIAYHDPADETDELSVIVRPRGDGDAIFNETVDGPLGSYGQTVELNESQAEDDWVIEFDAGERHRSVIPVGGGSVAFPVSMPQWLITILMTMAVTFVGALYGPRT